MHKLKSKSSTLLLRTCQVLNNKAKTVDLVKKEGKSLLGKIYVGKNTNS